MVKEEYIQVAVKQALRSSLTQKHGAVVIKDNKIIAEGFNRYVQSCSIKTKGVKLSIHAEKDALSKCSDTDLVGTSLIVVRISPDGKLIMSKPCQNCQKFIERKRVSVVYYSYSILPKKKNTNSKRSFKSNYIN